MPESWLCGNFGSSLGGNANNVKVIYPSIENVKQSHDGMLGGACLPYQSQTHQKQPWLRLLLWSGK